MNLHFVHDNNVTNIFIEQYSRICGLENNKFIIYKTNSIFGNPEKNKIKNDKVLVAPYNSKEFYELIGNLNSYDRIFYHFLDDQMCNFINRHSNLSARFLWGFWGSDLYSPLNYFADVLYDDLSMQYFKENKNETFSYTNSNLINFLKKNKRLWFGKYFDSVALNKKRKAIARIDYFLHYNEADFKLMREKFRTNAGFHPFFYYQDDYSELKLSPPEGVTTIRNKFGLDAGIPTILIGNSSSLSNNHISVLYNLKKLNNDNFRIICPLSYSDKKSALFVSNLGKQLFGDRFIPILDFLNKEDYRNLLYCADVAIMNHLRAEAAGNIFILLAMGKKVFCNEKSTLYTFLVKHNLHIFPTQSIVADGQPLINDLTEAQKEFNHNKISELFSVQQAEKFMFEINRL